MKCKKCGEENSDAKRTCSRCGVFLEGYTLNNVTGEYGYRGADGNFYKSEEDFRARCSGATLSPDGKQIDLQIGINLTPLDLENLMPFTDKMSKAECYGKGMYDLATQVKRFADNAKAAKESQSYMYWGAILDGLIDNLEHLTHGILLQKIKK